MSEKQAKAPWTPETLALLGKMPDSELARRVGCTAQAVSLKRNKLHIPRFISSSHRVHRVHWGETELGLLRNHSDKEVAKMTGRSLTEIAAKRRDTF